MNKWLSDEEIIKIVNENEPRAFVPQQQVRKVGWQAKEANRLRAGLECLKEYVNEMIQCSIMRDDVVNNELADFEDNLLCRISELLDNDRPT